jgi:hypothetical protein
MPLLSYASDGQGTPVSGVLPMNEDFQRIIDSVPEDEPRSRLEPYREAILRWRRQGRSYRRICKLLADNFDLEVGKSALHEFVQRRSRPRKVNTEPEIEQPMIPAAEPDQAARHGKRLTAEERAAQVEFIRSLNQPTLEEQPKLGWNFDLDKPRTIQKL